MKVSVSTKAEVRGGRWYLTTQLGNESGAPALFLRVQAEREKSGDRILPAIYDSNYVALMPGESRTVKTELAISDARGERPRISLKGFNVVAG